MNCNAIVAESRNKLMSAIHDYVSVSYQLRIAQDKADRAKEAIEKAIRDFEQATCSAERAFLTSGKS